MPGHFAFVIVTLHGIFFLTIAYSDHESGKIALWHSFSKVTLRFTRFADEIF